MKLQVGVTATALDLASALEGDSGTFVCQQGGQSYLVGAQEGHSISSGPTPFGVRVIEANVSQSQPEPWKITKIAEADFTNTYRGQQAQQQATRRQQEART
jgi:hypothetical protein